MFPPCSVKTALVNDAASEDRSHDLRIMGPTRCQLRYRRLNVVFHVWEMSKLAAAGRKYVGWMWLVLR